MVRTQQQAFREYYASMSDEELLAIAQNRESFIDVAQEAIDVELRRRHLVHPAPPPAPQKQTFFAHCEHGLARLGHLLHHPAAHH